MIMIKESTISVTNSLSGISAGETIVITQHISHKWWVKLWYFLTFRSLPSHIDHKYIVKSVDSNTCTTVVSPEIGLRCKESLSFRPIRQDQPNFSIVQNNFKRRGR